MNARHFLAVDLGATSGRVILAALSDDGIALDVLHRFPNRLVSLGGKYYWNLYALYEEIVEGLRLAGRRGIPIESIGIDTWGVDMAFVAADGSLCGLPRAYRDPYTNGAPEAFFAERMPRREVYDRTGIQIMNFNSLYQLYAARREGSSALAHAASALFMPDALAYLLTGEQVCEYTILSTSQFMNPHTKRPDAELLRAAGVDPALFPRAAMPGERIGTLCDAAARRTGLGTVPVVAVAGHDTASAVAAVPAADERFAYLSSGTWSLMGVEVPAPVISDETYALNFTNEGGVDSTVRLLKNITGMWLLEQCRAAWTAAGRDYSYPEIMRMTEAAAPSPALLGPDAEVLENLRKLAPFPIETLHVIGGGAQNDLLNRMTARACGIPVVAGPSEATALGNVMVQARTAGLVGSLAEMRRYVRRSIATKTYEPTR